MRYLSIAILTLLSFKGLAQDTVDKKFRIPKYTIKWSPLHLMNHYPTVQFALEQRISKNISFQYDFGPVVNLMRNAQGEDPHMRGYKVKFEVRHYFTTISEHLWNPYVGGEFYYNSVNYTKRKTIGINCADGSCDYYRYVPYQMQYREPGINFKGGVLFRTNRFVMDFQVGIMARFINYTAINEPLDSREFQGEGDDVSIFPFEFLFGTVEEDRFVLSPSGCFRIGYVIK